MRRTVWGLALWVVGGGCTPTADLANTRDSFVDAAVALEAGTTAVQLPPDAPATSGLQVFSESPRQQFTGVAVSATGRVFVSFPRWDDPIAYAVAELVGGQQVPYPDQATNTPGDPDHFLSVQSVVVDGADRLWALDTGSTSAGAIVSQDLPKLVAIDLATDQVVKTIHFPSSVVLPSTVLNDVRLDLRRGTGGVAFVSDSSGTGPNAIIVVDLDTGHSWRKLNDDPSVKGDPDFMAEPEGRPMQLRAGVDGLALPGDGSRLYYTPLASRRLHSVSTAALSDETLPDAQVAATIQTETRTFASDGLVGDAHGHVYLTDWENSTIWLRVGPGQYATVAEDARLAWPDSMAISSDGFLYVTASQLNRMPRYNAGVDLRQRPYQLFRARIGSMPALLK
jgi:sugar lactone lactonase YvrE